MRFRFTRECQQRLHHQSLVGEIEKRLGETIEQPVAMRLGWIERIEVAGLEAMHYAAIGQVIANFLTGEIHDN
jgi:hypothetical protein